MRSSKRFYADLAPSGFCLSISTMHRYNGRWWEYQANQMIGALLLPRLLAREALSSFLIAQGQLGADAIGSNKAGRSRFSCLSDVFDVNPAVARIRVDDRFSLYVANRAIDPLKYFIRTMYR